tara:strand:- start:10 stop:525 length:516 start_codon:yes stop_codon:yes gene_type:complete
MKIAILGKMCSGKTTTANLIKQMDSRYEIFSFGQKVKDVASDLFDMKEKDRSLLISIGTKMREIDSEVWVNYIMKKVNYKDFCIIDDLRYQNEYEACFKNGFVFIKLDISPELQKERIIRLYPTTYEDHLKNIDHQSEKNEWYQKRSCDLTIHSEMNIKSIEQKIYLLLSK